MQPCGSTLWEKILDTYNLGTRGIIKAYTLIILSLKYKKIINSQILYYDRRIERTVKEYKKLIIRISKSTRHYMKEYNNYKNKVHWNCAPFEWKSGKIIFFFFQQIYINIYDINLQDHITIISLQWK